MARAFRLLSLQQFLHPGLGFAAVVEEQVAALDAQHVLGGGLKTVAFRPGGQQQAHPGPLPGDLPGKIVGGEHRGHNAKALGPSSGVSVRRSRRRKAQARYA